MGKKGEKMKGGKLSMLMEKGMPSEKMSEEEEMPEEEGMAEGEDMEEGLESELEKPAEGDSMAAISDEELIAELRKRGLGPKDLAMAGDEEAEMESPAV